jgi:hypothetical protein
VNAIDSSRPERSAEHPARTVRSGPPAAAPAATVAPANEQLQAVPGERGRGGAAERQRGHRNRPERTRKPDAPAASGTSPGRRVGQDKQAADQAPGSRGRAVGHAKQQARGDAPPGQVKRVARGKATAPGQAKKQAVPEPKVKKKAPAQPVAPAPAAAAPQPTLSPAAERGQERKDAQPAKDAQAQIDATAGG